VATIGCGRSASCSGRSWSPPVHLRRSARRKTIRE
jgi:hypothetical protein